MLNNKLMKVKNGVLSFSDIPKLYEKLKENISNSFLYKIYFEKMKFKYLDFINILEKGERFISHYLNTFKFITYQIVSQEQYQIIFPKFSKRVNASSIIICTENECLIVENIHIQSIISIFEKINSISLKIDLTSTNLTNDELYIIDEIKSISKQYQVEIDSNNFVKYAISPIICYLIRRFYYPSIFFKDPSFFHFQMKSSEKYHVFNEKDFIILRTIDSGRNSIFNLAFHIESFYIFAIKTLVQNDSNQHFIELEFNFCEKCSHRCLTPFYGFVKNKEKIEGIVYEFMSNGSLFDFLHKNEISYFFSFITINRILQGLFYLHTSKSIIFRDLQPSNILINHDFLSFVSDYEMAIEVDSKDPNAYTQDIGSLSFCSYEQEYGKFVSFSTDIYSFGVNIFFLFEQKDFKRGLEITKFAEFIRELYLRCVEIEPHKRPDIFMIRKILVDHLLSIDSLKYYFPIEKIDCVKSYELIHFYHENIYLLSLDNNENDLNQYKQIFSDVSQFICYIGDIFYEGKGVQQNYLKAKEFYKLSAQYNNSNALCNLGDMYRNGKGVEKNLNKAKEYYELSANQMNSNALDRLGNIYHFGEGVEINYSKAKEYYELSAKYDNPDALYSIGYYYYIGRVVEKDVKKAEQYYLKSAKYNYAPALNGLGNYYLLNPEIKENVEKGMMYYEKATELNNANAFQNLGNIYYNGNFFIKQNIKKAIEYYEKAAELDNINALIALGNIYYLGKGVNKDYQKTLHYFSLAAEKDSADANNFIGFLYDTGRIVNKNYSIAKKYFEKAAAKNHPNALNSLGNIYLHGCDVPIDCLKAKELFERSSKLGNARAFFLLGNLYFEGGKGFEKNYKEAIKNFKISAEKGFSKAMYFLGDIYYKGIGLL